MYGLRYAYIKVQLNPFLYHERKLKLRMESIDNAPAHKPQHKNLFNMPLYYSMLCCDLQLDIACKLQFYVTLNLTVTGLNINFSIYSSIDYSKVKNQNINISVHFNISRFELYAKSYFLAQFKILNKNSL